MAQAVTGQHAAAAGVVAAAAAVREVVVVPGVIACEERISRFDLCMY